MKRFLTAAIMGMAAVSAIAAEVETGWSAGAAATFATYNWDNNAIDDSAVGMKLFGGFRVNRWFGVEGAYHNFGDFSEDTKPLLPGGDTDVGVDGFSLSGMFYAPIGSEDMDVFGRLGYYSFDQELPVDDVVIQRNNIDGFMTGAGIRVKVSDEFRIRAEGDWFDVDGASLWAVNLGIEYLFGAQKAAPVAAPVPAAPVVVAAAPEPPKDSDGDGVVDASDECPGTPAGARVNPKGCEEQLILRGVTFDFDSATLTPQSLLILDSVADILKQRPQFKSIEVRGHTDSRGADAYNMQLSERRAESVRQYLVDRGVDASKLVATGYGETQPIASNDTDDGRSQNRRVTLEFAQ